MHRILEACGVCNKTVFQNIYHVLRNIFWKKSSNLFVMCLSLNKFGIPCSHLFKIHRHNTEPHEIIRKETPLKTDIENTTSVTF